MLGARFAESQGKSEKLTCHATFWAGKLPWRVGFDPSVPGSGYFLLEPGDRRPFRPDVGNSPHPPRWRDELRGGGRHGGFPDGTRGRRKRDETESTTESGRPAGDRRDRRDSRA